MAESFAVGQEAQKARGFPLHLAAGLMEPQKLLKLTRVGAVWAYLEAGQTCLVDQALAEPYALDLLRLLEWVFKPFCFEA